MFTGIIESMGEIISLTNEGSNVHFEMKSPIITECRFEITTPKKGLT